MIQGRGRHGVTLFAALLVLAPGACQADRSPPAPAASPEAIFPVYTGPPDEYFHRQADCLRAAGWDAQVNAAGDGLSVASLPQEQRPAFMQALTECKERIGLPPPAEPLGDSEIRATYRYWLEMRECLMDLGYTISEPPSQDAFVESWSTGPWSPYNDVVDQASEGDWEELNRKCPQVPDTISE